MGVLELFKFLTLGLAITYGWANLVRALRGQGFSASSNFVFGFSTAAFISLHWLM